MFEVFSVQRGSNVDTSVNSMKSYVVGFMEGGRFESLNGWSCRSRCKARVERSRVGTKKLPGRGLFGSHASMGIHPWPLCQHGAPSPSAPPLLPARWQSLSLISCLDSPHRSAHPCHGPCEPFSVSAHFS